MRDKIDHPMTMEDKNLEKKHRTTLSDSSAPNAASQGAEVRPATVHNQHKAQQDMDAKKAVAEVEVVITNATVNDSKIFQDSRLTLIHDDIEYLLNKNKKRTSHQV